MKRRMLKFACLSTGAAGLLPVAMFEASVLAALSGIWLFFISIQIAEGPPISPGALRIPEGR